MTYNIEKYTFESVVEKLEDKQTALNTALVDSIDYGNRVYVVRDNETKLVVGIFMGGQGASSCLDGP
jgi:hypothetical protein